MDCHTHNKSVAIVQEVRWSLESTKPDCCGTVPSKDKLILQECYVQFAMENSIVIPTTTSLSNEEIDELWVTDEELKAAPQKRIKEAARSQKKNRKDYIQAYIHVWDICSNFTKDEPKAADSHAPSQVLSKKLAEEETSKRV